MEKFISQWRLCNSCSTSFASADKESPEVIPGPTRVLPGRLSVSRTFGDVETKLASLGGKSGVIIATPDIRSFDIAPNHDFILIGSDGVFDKLSNREVVHCVMERLKQPPQNTGRNVHLECGLAAECVIKHAILKESTDNLTVTMIALDNYKRIFKERIKEKQEVLVGKKRSVDAYATTRVAYNP